MLYVLFFFILTSTTPSLAIRHDVINGLEDLSPAFGGVNEFLEWASENCADCGSTIGSLFRGVDEAKFLQDSVWQGNTLTVTLTEDRLYGEIVAKSRVPTMWTLDKKCILTFGEQNGQKRTVQLQGIGLQPSPQGVDLYERAMKHSGLDPTKCLGEEECVEAEVKAAGKYLSDKWKTIKKEDGKITRLLKTTYASNTIYYAVKSQGGNKWARIFYAWIVPSPLHLTSLTFEDGTVYATREIVQNPKYTNYHFVMKAELAGRKTLLETTGKAAVTVANKFARSGFNFGRMMAYGLSEESLKELSKVGPGEVSAITNLFTWCAGTKEDELPECTGSTPGRVGWAPSPKQ